MNESITLEKKGLNRWVSMRSAFRSASILDRCKPDVIEKAISHVGDISVVSVAVNNSGEYRPSQPFYESPPPLQSYALTGLPEFCEVVVHQRNPGGHVAEIKVCVPLDWNHRFLGTGGAGNRTSLEGVEAMRGMVMRMPVPVRGATIPRALTNGFATAATDGANRHEGGDEWALTETGELDWELIRNWVHRSTHEMTVVGKAVTEAIHGSPPLYSYFLGGSGGGRQAMAQAQYYPEDYDGVWSLDPAINWTRFIPAMVWPALVMKEHGLLPPPKLEAFRAAAIAACDGRDGLKDGIIGAFDPCEFDPEAVVGQDTPAGEITATDALVMRKIWEGPRTSSGEFLWYGLLPGTESWGNNIFGGGLCMTMEVEGKVVPIASYESWFRLWVLRDPKWDWTTMTFEQYEELYGRGVRELAEVATDNPDLSGLRDSGHKLLLTHGANDELIFSQGTVDYYRRVVEAMGGEEETASFARLFITDGDGHGHCTKGPGLSLAGGMIALMEWVENGNAPDQIIAEKYDLDAGKVTKTRPAYPYPWVTQYSGEGDPNDASSYTRERIPETITAG